MSKLKSLSLAAMLVAGVSSAASASCNVTRFAFHRGETVGTAMSVASGKGCGVSLHAGGRSAFHSVSIIASPRNGSLMNRGGLGVSYRSRPGFRGTDSFTFAVTGQLAQGPGTARIRVDVSVQ